MQRKPIWSLLFAFTFLHAQDTATKHDVVEQQHGLSQAVLQTDNNTMKTMKTMKAAGPHLGTEIPLSRRSKWTVVCDSEDPNSPCGNLIDGSSGTFWQTKKGKTGIQNPDPLPHTITVDLRVIENVCAIRMEPLKDAKKGGAIAGHKVYLSSDNETWGDPVAFGTWFGDASDKFAIFEPKKAQFVRLQVTSASMQTQHISVSELSIWSNETHASPPTSMGRWGPTIDFPLVPVGVWIDPPSGKVISFSSYAHDDFSQDSDLKQTLTATWDPDTQIVSQRLVKETKHDMFCPGMSLDVRGRMLISGGSSAHKVSIYDPADDSWKSIAGMKRARGYHGSTTCADGRIFVIGGSWSPNGRPRGSRTGEIYDPAENGNWTLLEGCPAEPIQTTEDWEKLYRADNHVWLHGWKNNSVFHAGPARDMHWITTTEGGAIEWAGRREDHDAMCGVAAMYDAAEGKILTTGGAPQYRYRDDDGNPRGSKASKGALVVTLGQVNSTVSLKPAGQGMHYQRIFHHAVILPNGDTFVVGGQIEGVGFTDDTAILRPETYSPTQDVWMPMANHSIIRTYHSFGLLLADATVLVGGGGLCGTCTVNHFDAQVYTAPYLLTPEGERALRPKIMSISATSVHPGDKLTVNTDFDVVDASLVRYGGATHSLNNDQRRIALKLQKISAAFQYSVNIPQDGGVAIPGYWMLFVMNAEGVPSKATNVQILIARALGG